MSKARNLSLLSAVEAGATADQTKSDIEGLGIAASSVTGALPAISGASLTGLSTKLVGVFSPTSHNTTGTASTQTIDLSSHDDQLSNYTDYLTQSGGILTIVKAGLYHVDVKVLMYTTHSSAEFNLDLTVSGHTAFSQRLVAQSGWNTSIASGTYSLSVGNTITATVYNSHPSTYFYHQGPNWTKMVVTYLG